jgi:ribonuclease HI
MHFDGSQMLDGVGANVVLTSPKGDMLQYVLQVHFRASNNIAEYESLVHGLKLAKEIGIRRILCFGHSDLVVHQVTRANSTNVLNEGLRIGETGRRMNSKVILVEIGVYQK